MGEMCRQCFRNEVRNVAGKDLSGGFDLWCLDCLASQLQEDLQKGPAEVWDMHCYDMASRCVKVGQTSYALSYLSLAKAIGNSIRDPLNLSDCARKYVELLQDTWGARQCLLDAEDHANCQDDWERIARAWRFAGDQDKSEAAIRRARETR